MSTSKLLTVTIVCFLLGGIALIANTFTVTDDSDRIYGAGVRSFFDRNYEEAVTILSEIEDIKSVDPRPYYFLGLAYLRQEKTDKADQYFKQAAQLEYGGRAVRDYAVSESLRRIQGEERMRIEKIRSEERASARQREQQFQETRYGSESTAKRGTGASQGQRENLAVSQSRAGNVSNNAFGVRPIAPITTTDDDSTTRQVDSNLFGDVTNSINEEPLTPDPPSPVALLPVTPVQTEHTAPPDVPVVVLGEGSWGGDQSGTMASPASLATQGARETARSIGRGLGTLFVRRAGGE